MYDILELNKKSIEELRAIADDLKLKKINSLEKEKLIYRIIDEQAINGIAEKESEKPAKPARKKRERVDKPAASVEEKEKKTEAGERKHRQRKVEKQEVQAPAKKEESIKNNPPAPAKQEEAQKEEKQPVEHTNKNGTSGQHTTITLKKSEFDGIIEATGVMELMPDGFGFLRSSDYNYLSSPDDIYV